MSLTHALKWSFFAELASKAISPVVFIVLARLLTPEDFGVMTAAMMVIAFTQIFWEAGMGKALIQRLTDTQEAANVAFWINIALGLLIATALFVVAKPVAATFFHDDRVTAVLQVMTLQVLLGAISSVHTALLQKDMGFKKLFWVRFVTVSLPGLASIPLALNGMGYWALVAGALVGQLAQVIMLWRTSHWRPRWTFDTRVAKEMGRFGAWVGASGLLAWFYLWADSLIVGMYLGSHDLGLYRTGNMFSIMIFGMVFGPIAPVLYSYLSKMGGDKIRLKSMIEKVIRSLTIIAIPLAVILVALSSQIGEVLFGSKWEGISFVIAVMALMHGFSWVVGMNGEFYRAAGKPSYETIVTAGTLVIYLLAYLYSIQQGFEVFVWTRLGLALGALLLHLLVLKKLLAVSMLPILGYVIVITMITAVPAYLLDYVFNMLHLNVWIRVCFEGFILVSIFGTVIYFIERNGLIKEVKLRLKEAVR